MFENTLPPDRIPDMVMPAIFQQWFFVAMCIPVLIALYFSLRYWRRTGSPLGVLFLLGGAFSYLNEPIVDVLGKCWWPPIGNWTFMEVFGVHLPMFGIPVYMWYMGGQAFLAYRLIEKGISMRGLYVLYAFAFITDLALELPAVNMGVYTYYGLTQPLVFFKFPLWWPFVNALMPIMMGAVIYRLKPLLVGVKSLLIIPLMWMLGAAVNGLVAAPVWIALNTDVGPGVTHLAALFTIGLGMMTCYGIGLLVAVDSPDLSIGDKRIVAPVKMVR